MEIEFTKNKVYYKIFDRTYTQSNGVYNKYKDTTPENLAKIQQNITQIKSEASAEEIVILKQVHGNRVVFAGQSVFNEETAADGSVTDQKGVLLCVLTADCVPVLFASDDGSVIGAAHCGWRSAKSDIISNVCSMMQEKGAKGIRAIIGPAIQQKSYEVDADYYQAFLNDEADYADLFIESTKKDHYMFDLPTYVKRKLAQEDIELIKHIDEDTYSMPEKYPSYRRSTHKGEIYSQNILSTIMLK